MGIYVYKNLIAIELVEMGYEIIKLDVNKRQPQKTVFIFKDEKGILDVINSLKNKYWNG